MLASFRAWLTIGIAIVALVGLMYFYGLLAVGALSGNVPKLTSDQVALATILSGLVGGIVAAGFGVNKPNDRRSKDGRLARKVGGLRAFLQPRQNWTDPKLMGSAYAVA